MNPTVPIEKHVVLVGAGNAHLVFLKRWRMSPWPGVAVTLVSEFAEIPYSAMVPGHIAGEYRWDEITLDLVRFCRLVNVRFVASRVTAIDTARSRVEFVERPAMTFDVLSVGLGSLPASPLDNAGSEWSLSIRPLGRLVSELGGSTNRCGNRLDRFISPSSVAERAVVSWPWRFDVGRKTPPVFE